MGIILVTASVAVLGGNGQLNLAELGATDI